MDIDTLKSELKQHLITYLNLQDMAPEELKDDEALFGDKLGLDSIDSLEMIVMLEREYGVKITNPREGRKVLVDINTMAAYILQNRDKTST